MEYELNASQGDFIVQNTMTRSWIAHNFLLIPHVGLSFRFLRNGDKSVHEATIDVAKECHSWFEQSGIIMFTCLP